MEANKMHHYLPENVVDKDFVSLLSVSALKIPYIHGPHMSPRWCYQGIFLALRLTPIIQTQPVVGSSMAMCVPWISGTPKPSTHGWGHLFGNSRCFAIHSPPKEIDFWRTHPPAHGVFEISHILLLHRLMNSPQRSLSSLYLAHIFRDV